ncbi:MAG TPA: Hsp20/alpha crystallin family protein [Solirubrobacteraceae bacterium]|jgi:HSP20 family protein
MALIRWEPAAELNTIQNEMNRLFNNFFDQPASGRDGTPGRRCVPAMDLIETADRYVLRADLPGSSGQDVSVQLEGNLLTISGKRDAEHEHDAQGYYRVERAFGSFARSLSVPEGIDPDAVRGHFDRGVLEITIPKPEQKKPRQVQISLRTRPTDNPDTIDVTDRADPQTNSHDPVPA